MARSSDSDRRVDERLRRAELRLLAAPRRPRFADDRPDEQPDDDRAGVQPNLREDGRQVEADDRFADTETDEEEFALDVPASAPRQLPRVPGRPRRFGGRQLLVVAVLVAAGLLLAGWAVLRARPVALAAPISDPTAPATSPASAPPATSAATSAASATTSSTSSTSSTSPNAAAAGIEVHVLGAVRRPGLQRLAEGARVADAIRAAGGMTDAAAPGRLNLAQPLGDGQQLYLARRGQGESKIVDPTPVAQNPTGNTGASSGASSGLSSAGSGDPAGASGGSSAESSGTVDLNQATEAELDALPGIGPVTAGKIIAWRTQHGRFSKITELQEVDGIGPKTYADLAPHVRV